MARDSRPAEHECQTLHCLNKIKRTCGGLTKIVDAGICRTCAAPARARAGAGAPFASQARNDLVPIWRSNMPKVFTIYCHGSGQCRDVGETEIVNYFGHPGAQD